jgi:molybdopterin-dependent oxidoreductase alpha subunit
MLFSSARGLSARRLPLGNARRQGSVAPPFGTRVGVHQVGGDAQQPGPHIEPLRTVGGPPAERDQEGFAEQVVGQLTGAAAQVAMHGGRVRVFFALGGNFLQATPDTEFTAAALRQCRLTAHVSIKPNRAHLVGGDRALILPCLGRSERDVQLSGEQLVSTENSMGVVQMSHGVLDPASPQLLSEPAIVARLARATLGPRTTVDWEWLVADYNRIRDAIERVIPAFERYNDRVRMPGGFYLPNSARRREFLTATGKANFTVHPLPRLVLRPGQLVLTTVRSHDQFNTTIYGLNDRYRGVRGGRRVVFMNADDMRERGLGDGTLVDITSYHDGEQRHARNFRVVEYDVPRGSAAAYFPEANVLVAAGSVAEKSNTPASKSIVVSVERAR